MEERIKILYRKVLNELKPSGFRKGEKVTIYRVFSFLFSKRGLERVFRLLRKTGLLIIRIITGQRIMAPTYNKWLTNYNKNKPALPDIKKDIDSWSNKPLISVIMPVYNPDLSFFKNAINSLLSQYYDNWELCISDDNSEVETKEKIKELSYNDKRIKIHFKQENSNISENMNTAAGLARGEYLAFLDQDDLLSSDALYYMAKEILNSTPDVIYSDEDKIDEKGALYEPFFKPDFSPHSLLSRNYINHFLVIKKELFNKVSGFRTGFEGAQDHDLLLRVSEMNVNIKHVPRVLYHWREHKHSTALNPESKLWAFDSGKNAVKESLERKGFESDIEMQPEVPGNYNIRIKLKERPFVSIIIPNKDKADILKVCLDSIFLRTFYKDFEIVLIDNGSVEKETFDLYSEYKSKHKNFKVYDYNKEFNFSSLMNLGNLKSIGDYLLLLNNDTEIISEDWIEKMLSFAQLPDAGAIGAKLFFNNNKIQHVGVVLGIRGIVGHVYVGSEGDNPGYFQCNNVVTNYSAVTAACLMVKKEKFEIVGGFDESLAVEYNDVDFCLKLLEKGWYNIYLPDVNLYHYESLTRGHPSSSKAGNQRHLKEAGYFTGRWQELIKNDPFYNINLSRHYTEFQYDV